MNQEDFERNYLKNDATATETTRQRSIISNGIQYLTKWSPLARIYSLLPILYWLPRYKWHKDLHGDIVGGLTVGIMHVPQGMAYATLASLPPVYGLYSSFFASTIYAFFGTSRHISIGVFAVGSMMVGNARLRLLPNPEPNVTDLVNSTYIPGNNYFEREELTPVMVTSALTFGVGVAQIIMAFLHLGFLTTYLSDPLVSGFTTGAACHVFMAQINKILGVKLPRYSGIGQLFLMLRDLVKAIPAANIYTVALSAFGLVFLKAGKVWINPFIQKRYSVPFPLELILVILTTVFSSIVGLKKRYGIHIVDHVPQGVPEPAIPKYNLLPSMIADCIGIAFVCYTFVISMAKLFAKKRKYNIDPEQELYAVSFMSLLSSFFPVYPCGASLSRSSVCEQSGTRTQLYTLFSSSLLLAVIIWMGPLLEPLPMCILACIVVVSLESLFLHVKELPMLWKVCPFDFFIWIISCTATMTTTVTMGLLVAVFFNIFSITLREQWPKLRILGQFPTKGIYKPERYYSCLPSSNRFRILRFDGPLHFANVDKFKEQFDDILKIQLENVNSDANSSFQLKSSLKSAEHCVEESCSQNDTMLVLDCSKITYVDHMGLGILKQAYFDAKNLRCQMLLADLTEDILQMFRKVGFYEQIPKSAIFPNIQQALLYSGV